MQKQNIAEMLLKRLLKNKKMEVIKFLGENPGLAPGMKPRNIFLNL